MARQSDICDELEWFVDMLGYQDFLEYFIENNKNKNHNGVITYTRGRTHLGKPDGLIFSSGHWVGMRNNKILNSYVKNHQIRGTAHFCQSFSLMYYLNEDRNLQARQYTDNIKEVMRFWINIFDNDPVIRKFFLDKSKQFWPNVVPIIGVKPISKYKYNDLKKYMEWVSLNADYLKACKEG
jgi:hypothetical protein